MKRVVVFGFLLVLATACGSNDETDQTAFESPAGSADELAGTSGSGIKSGPEQSLETIVGFTYQAQEAWGFCPDKFLEVNISRSDQDQFEFSATLVKEAADDEDQLCLETGMDKCLVAESLPGRILDGDESRQIVDTFAGLAFGEVPDWCEDLEYEPCRIDLYQWDFEEGEPLVAHGDKCYDQHLDEGSQAAIQSLLLDLARPGLDNSGQDEKDPGASNQG